MANVAEQAAKGSKRRHNTADGAKQEIDDEIDDGTQLPNTTISKLAAKRAKLPGPAGSDGRVMGQTRFDQAGQMYYRKNNQENWEAAVFHKDIRARLLAETDQLGSYDILHAIFPPEQRRGLRAENWYDNGRIVLDLDNHPVKLYTDIPLACSSAMEGGWMEAIRRKNPMITHKDFRARMPHSRGEEGYTKRLCGITALSNRQWRFRKLTGCLAWDARAGNDKIRRYMVNLYPASCLQANSSKAFRDLTKIELEEIEQLNKGQFPERARVRAGTPPTYETEHAVMSMPGLGAGEKRKRATTPPHRGPGFNEFIEEQEDIEGDTIVVGGLRDGHAACGSRKRACREYGYSGFQNQNTPVLGPRQSQRAHEMRKRVRKPLSLETRAHTFADEEDIGDAIVVAAVIQTHDVRECQERPRQGQSYNDTQQKLYDDSDTQGGMTAHFQSNPHQGRTQLALAASMEVQGGTTANPSNPFAHSSSYLPPDYHRECAQSYQSEVREKHQPKFQDVEEDGLSPSPRYFSSPRYTSRRDNSVQYRPSTQQFVRRVEGQNMSLDFPVMVEEDVASTGGQESEEFLSLIDPRLLNLPPASPRCKVTRLPSTEASLAINQPQHNYLSLSAPNSNVADYPAVPETYNPHDDDRVDFQQPPEESTLWLWRNRIIL
ncbi:MAG: hypothetical protein Q9187_002909 [Circinaria calcarea]